MEEEIRKAAEFLKKGKVILYPTDTVWGIGCDATSKKAVEKVFRIKRRESGKSMIVLVKNVDQLSHYVKTVPSIVHDLIDSMQTPLTIIYPNAINLAGNVIAEDGSIAIRVATDEFCQRMIDQFGKPVVSTSANYSGQPTPLIFSRIPGEIIQEVDHVVDYHRDQIMRMKPSTIIKIDERGNFQVIRN